MELTAKDARILLEALPEALPQSNVPPLLLERMHLIIRDGYAAGFAPPLTLREEDVARLRDAVAKRGGNPRSVKRALVELVDHNENKLHYALETDYLPDWAARAVPKANLLPDNDLTQAILNASEEARLSDFSTAFDAVRVKFPSQYGLHMKNFENGLREWNDDGKKRELPPKPLLDAHSQVYSDPSDPCAAIITNPSVEALHYFNAEANYEKVDFVRASDYVSASQIKSSPDKGRAR